MESISTQKASPFRFPAANPILKKNASVSAIIHGDTESTGKHYYVDALERFKRDHASVDKQQRQQQRQKAQNGRSKRRYESIERSNSLRKLEDDNVSRLHEKQRLAQETYKVGTKMSIYSHSLPIDPINLKYQESERGKYQKYIDNEKEMGKMVRAHHLQMCGSSGYNIINGYNSHMVEDMVSGENYPNFQNKLFKYYQQFKITPNQVS